MRARKLLYRGAFCVCAGVFVFFTGAADQSNFVAGIGALLLIGGVTAIVKARSRPI